MPPTSTAADTSRPTGRAAPRPGAPASSRAPAAPESLRQELARLGSDAGALAGTLRRRLRRTWWTVLAMASGVGVDWWRPAPGRSRSALSRLRRGRSPVPTGGVLGHVLPWRRALAVGVVAFGTWALLDAPTLLHNAEGSPLGVRRSVAMALLRPVAAVSDGLGLSHVVGAADRLMGRHGPGVVQVVGRVPRARRPHLARPPAAHPAPPASDALPSLPQPTPSAPLRVLAVGDSLGVDFGGPFADALAGTGVANAAVDAHVDTGLTRPDYFDWPAELQADLARDHPEAVVVFLGANDPQNMVEGGSALAFGTPAWDAAYAARVGQFMAEATGAGARVLWVGMPPMQDGGLDSEMQQVNALYQTEAAAHPGVTFVSSWTVLGTPQGGYAQYLPDASGAPVMVREPDGTHLAPGGGQRLSQAVMAAMDRAWGLSLVP